MASRRPRRRHAIAAAGIPGLLAIGAVAPMAAGAPSVKPDTAIQASTAAATVGSTSDGASITLAALQTGFLNLGFGAGGARLSDVLHGLVTAGTISAAQQTAIEDAVTAAREAARADRAAGASGHDGPHGPVLSDVLADLVTKGTITAAQQTAIEDAIDAARLAPITAFLDAQVTAGTIDASEKAAILAAIETAETTGAPGGGPGYRGPGGPLGGVLDALVTDGTLTADQQTKLATAWQAAREAEELARVGAFLDTQVTAGTIDASEKSAILSAFQAAEAAESSTPPASPPSSSPAPGDGQRAGHGHGPHGELAAVLDALVTDGTLTDAQRTALETALEAAHQAGGPQ